MKWLLVLGILVFAAFQLRKALVRHHIFGPAFRVLLAHDAPSRPMTSREYAKGSLLFLGFAVLSGACHFGLIRLAEGVSWIDLSSPLAAIFVKTTLWVAALAVGGAIYTTIEAIRRSFLERKTGS